MSNENCKIGPDFKALNFEQMAYDLALIYAKSTFEDSEKDSDAVKRLRERFVFAYGYFSQSNEESISHVWDKVSADGHKFK